MTHIKRTFDLPGGGTLTPRRVAGNTRDEMRRWFDEQMPHDRIDEAVAAQSTHRSASSMALSPEFD